MPLTVVLSNTAGVPIYEQIAQQVRDAILTGRVEADEALPSIRALARDLRVSVITTTRAYSDLVAEGFLANVPGKGYFALPRNSELVHEQVLREVEEHLDRAVERARLVGLSSEELHTMLDTVMTTSQAPGGEPGESAKES
ncbi:GntR family transcriptional regulator [Actinomyces sp. 2119]|uniref:GntR family transcriptional regulator n=1 Tax=Actinomyces sp. 2119 TaxID=2321393 RepID=UPI000E6CB8F1|nr:GntR family transcriptional regulator [Actinomyces sp. 2119]RJF44003.1 GntR family transcriptional regulator [Actinomyces sp. 2119]